MGVFFRLICPQCGRIFARSAGTGSHGLNIGTDSDDAGEPFECPGCSHLFEPDSPDFPAAVLAWSRWD